MVAGFLFLCDLIVTHLGEGRARVWRDYAPFLTGCHRYSKDSLITPAGKTIVAITE